MKGSTEPTTAIELDQLVDDELDRESRQALIKRLGGEADGWQRCALAFLEAQSWRRNMPALVGETCGAGIEKKVVAPVRPPAARPWQMVALAVVVALTLGFVAGRGLRFLPNQPDATVEKTPSGDRQEVPRNANAEPRLVGMAAWDNDKGGRQMLPVVSGGGLDKEWLQRRPRHISQYQQQVLKRKGWHIEEHRRLVDVTLTDGSQLTIPIDSIRYRFVGRRLY